MHAVTQEQLATRPQNHAVNKGFIQRNGGVDDEESQMQRLQKWRGDMKLPRTGDRITYTFTGDATFRGRVLATHKVSASCLLVNLLDALLFCVLPFCYCSYSNRRPAFRARVLPGPNAQARPRPRLLQRAGEKTRVTHSRTPHALAHSRIH
jgi:hypothetical protein